MILERMTSGDDEERLIAGADCLGYGVATTGTNRYNVDTYDDGATADFGAPSSSSYEKSVYATYTAIGSNLTRGFPQVYCG